MDDDAETVAPAAVGPAPDPLTDLLRNGLDALTQLVAPRPAGSAAAPSLFERVRDEGSGQSYLKIRMPEPEVVDRVVGALQALLAGLKG